MDNQIIIDYIEKANPWWTQDIDIGEFKEREIHAKIQRFMNTKQILALTGLRRVGKTMTIKKIILEELKKGFPKRNIFYFSFDEFFKIRLFEIIKLFEKITENNIRERKYIIAFDEIQKVPDWSEQLKVIYDLYPNLKILITGSESLFIRKKSKESLAGRIFEFKINPLTFKEYLHFKNIKIDNISLQKEMLLKEFNNFIKNNGFPEIINETEEVIEKYLRESVIEKIIYRDMPEVFEIKDSSILKSLFEIIYNNPGQIIEIQDLADELNVSRQIVSIYLEYLEESFLIKKLYNFSKNARKTQRRLKKYYPTIINPVLTKNFFSRVFEQFIIVELDAEYFWRDSYKNEVDIIKMKKNKIIPIEIKSGDLKERHTKPMNIFQKKFKTKEGIIITFDKKDDINGIKAIPFYEYLLKEN